MGDLLLTHYARPYTKFLTVPQRPRPADYTECGAYDSKLASAYYKAVKSDAKLALRREGSTAFYKLAHAETEQFGWEKCCMLSAVAFERLLDCKGNAKDVASAFEFLMGSLSSKTLSANSRIEPDPHPAWREAQFNWTISKKWMKEHYELRSRTIHGSPDPNPSSNWTALQHIVVAGFLFPLLVKLTLAQANFYLLTLADKASLGALDDLLVCDWGGQKRLSNWPKILSRAISAMELKQIVEHILAKG